MTNLKAAKALRLTVPTGSSRRQRYRGFKAADDDVSWPSWLGRDQMSLSAVVIFIATFLSLSVAAAQQPAQLGVPEAAKAVAGTSIDGNVTVVPSATSTTLFQGVAPPNGFMVRVYKAAPTPYINSEGCFVNDNGPVNNRGGGLYIVPDFGGTSGTFITPPGYKPIGAVSVWCAQRVYISARGW
jgi:hypothetical protein